MAPSSSAEPVDLLDASIEQLQQLQSSGQLTALELVNFYLGRIEQYDQKGPSLNSIAHLNPEALNQARRLDDERRKSGPRSLLHGMVVLVKDNYETVDMPTTAGSALFAGFSPQRDAFQVERLKAAGAVVLGKTNMHEFAYGITTEGSGFGATLNPYDPTRNPGGSSGGTGAAVAANMAVFGMGSDTCGSIRIPAAHNNLVGLRGTQGLSSRRGIVPLSTTQDIGGPLARTTRDLAIALDVTVGFDAQDLQTAESVGYTHDYLASLQVRRGLRVGVLTDWMIQEPADEAVAAVVSGALQDLARNAAWQLQPVASEAVNRHLDRPLNGHFVLIHDFRTDMEAYLSANPTLGYGSLQEMLAATRHHPSITSSLEASAAMTEASRPMYLQELAQRATLRRALLALMARHQLDALAYPTIRQVAAPVGDPQFGTNCRLAANSGLPAISVPAGFIGDLPVGMEFLAEPWAEQKLLDMAFTAEQLQPRRRLPGLLGSE